MVKKFINNLLKKSDSEQKENKKEEEVPDELPPLVDDSSDAAATDDATAEKSNGFDDLDAATQDAPEQTPSSDDDLSLNSEIKDTSAQAPAQNSLDDEVVEESAPTPKKIEVPQETGIAATTQEQLPPEPQTAPQEIGISAPTQNQMPTPPQMQAKEEVIEDIPTQQAPAKEMSVHIDQPITSMNEKIKEPIQESMHSVDSIMDMPDSKQPSFFSDLIDVFENQGVKEKLIKQDLYKRMRDYWYYHPPKRGTLKDKDQIQNTMMEELKHLQTLEERWIMQKKFLEEDRRILAERGKEIREKINGLQLTLAQLKLYDNVSENKGFHLSNGIIVHSVEELMKTLEVIDDETFAHHVLHEKNDFANWIFHVVENHSLATKITHAKTRQEMVAILENELLGNLDEIDPKHYFILKDGRVLKNITDLLVTMYEIDDETFEYHKTRADFSKWIKNIFKNDRLADAVHAARTKEEIIEILRK